MANTTQNIRLLSGKSAEEASVLFQFVRRWFYHKYTEARMIGINIISTTRRDGSVEESQVNHDFATFPGSTDLSIDFKVRLSCASYSVTPIIVDALRSGRGTGAIQVKTLDGITIAQATLTKSFANTNCLTFKDFAEYLQFNGVDPSTPLVHITDESCELTISLFFQIISGTQSELQNQMTCDHVFGVDHVKLPVNATAASDISISFDTDCKSGSAHEHTILITGRTGDVRVSEIKQLLQNKLTAAVDIWSK